MSSGAGLALTPVFFDKETKKEREITEEERERLTNDLVDQHMKYRAELRRQAAEREEALQKAIAANMEKLRESRRNNPNWGESSSFRCLSLSLTCSCCHGAHAAWRVLFRVRLKQRRCCFPGQTQGHAERRSLWPLRLSAATTRMHSTS